jgi:hypothetical protein
VTGECLAIVSLSCKAPRDVLGSQRERPTHSWLRNCKQSPNPNSKPVRSRNPARARRRRGPNMLVAYDDRLTEHLAGVEPLSSSHTLWRCSQTADAPSPASADPTPMEAMKPMSGERNGGPAIWVIRRRPARRTHCASPISVRRRPFPAFRRWLGSHPL